MFLWSVPFWVLKRMNQGVRDLERDGKITSTNQEIRLNGQSRPKNQKCKWSWALEVVMFRWTVDQLAPFKNKLEGNGGEMYRKNSHHFFYCQPGVHLWWWSSFLQDSLNISFRILLCFQVNPGQKILCCYFKKSASYKGYKRFFTRKLTVHLRAARVCCRFSL